MPPSVEQGWSPLTSVWSSPLAPPASATPPAWTPAAPVTEDDIRVGPGGRIHGVDGMLDQIAQALTRHAGPMFARDVLPIVQRDEALHTRVGQAAGVAMADNLRPWIIAGVGALGVLAAIEAYRFYSHTGARRARR